MPDKEADNQEVNSVDVFPSQEENTDNNDDFSEDSDYFSDERRENLLIKTTTIEASMETPFLPPAFLRQYEETVPGSGKQIFDMVCKQQDFNIEIKKHQMDFNNRNLSRLEKLDGANIVEQQKTAIERTREIDIKERGQIFAFILAILLILLSGFFGARGHVALASVPIGIIVAVIITMFLQSRTTSKTDTVDDDT